MRDAVHRAICAIRREIMKNDDSRVVLGKVVLESKNLSPIAQRALRQKTDLGEAVDYDPRGL